MADPILIAVVLAAALVLARIDSHAVQTGAAVAVVGAFALAASRFIGRWLMRSARAEFEDQVVSAVREELAGQREEVAAAVQTKHEENAAAIQKIAEEVTAVRDSVDSQVETGTRYFLDIKRDVSWCKTELAEGTNLNATVERNTRWIREIAEHVGMTLEN